MGPLAIIVVDDRDDRDGRRAPRRRGVACGPKAALCDARISARSTRIRF